MSKPSRFLSYQHIRSAAEFDSIFKNGKRLSNRFFVMLYTNTTLDCSRLGVVVPKKNCPRAVDRNRIKRAIREKFRLNQQAWANVDMVVMLKSSPVKLPNQEQNEWLEKLFSQFITL